MVLAVVVAGCAPFAGSAIPDVEPTPAVSMDAGAPRSPSASAPVSASAPQPSAKPFAGDATPALPMPMPTVPADTRTGAELSTPFTVNGVVVVSRDHRVSADYVPAWAGGRHGLHPDALTAFDQLAAAATREGLTMTIRSGYRTYAAQADSFKRALAQYDESTARRYFAEPGASEHQTGLALDVWDGQHRGSAFAKMKHASWLATHAHEHGFIVRYPDGKTHITGVAWESWHLRYVGTDIASAFGPNSSLTLEEHLGLA